MKTSAAMIPPRTSLGLSEPDGLLHVLADGFWSLCGRRVKRIMPQRLAATWPWCPRCQRLEETISRGLMEDLAEQLADVMTRNLVLAELIAEQVMKNFRARPLEERVRAYWLVRQGQPAPPWVLKSCATSPRTRA